MQIAIPELPEELRQQIKESGGFCHRLPWTAPVPTGGGVVASQGSGIAVMSGFGRCQRTLCPLWDDETDRCKEAANG
jgi:hypothetical protein